MTTFSTGVVHSGDNPRFFINANIFRYDLVKISYVFKHEDIDVGEYLCALSGFNMLTICLNHLLNQFYFWQNMLEYFSICAWYRISAVKQFRVSFVVIYIWNCAKYHQWITDQALMSLRCFCAIINQICVSNVYFHDFKLFSITFWKVVKNKSNQPCDNKIIMGE